MSWDNKLLGAAREMLPGTISWPKAKNHLQQGTVTTVIALPGAVPFKQIAKCRGFQHMPAVG